MIEREEAIYQAMMYLTAYLGGKGIDYTRKFHCLNPNHADHHPSMDLLPDGRAVYCHACLTRMNVFNLIGVDYNTDSFREQLDIACKLFNIDYNSNQWEPEIPKKKIIPISKEERELLGIFTTLPNRKMNPLKGFIIYGYSENPMKKPENSELISIREDEEQGGGALFGKYTSPFKHWLNLQKDEEAYHALILNKCREATVRNMKYAQRLFSDYRFEDPRLAEEVLNDYVIRHRKIMEIYLRFGGKLNLQGKDISEEEALMKIKKGARIWDERVKEIQRWQEDCKKYRKRKVG